MQLNDERYHLIEKFTMPQLGRKRTIRIFLPKNYHLSSQAYPVIYMHDGQNLFDSSTSYGGESWKLPENLDAFFSENEGAILVGIDNGSEFNGLCRMYEYSPWKMDQNFTLLDWDPSIYQSGGEGRQYIDFLVSSLKPYVDTHYRTKPDRDNTFIAGSSMGGFISLFAIFQRPDIFSMAGVFSPAFWFNKSQMFDFLSNTHLSQKIKIYMDIGTEESSGRGIGFEKIYLDDANKANEILKINPFVTLQYVVEQGGIHNESAWARRYPIMLDFFFN